MMTIDSPQIIEPNDITSFFQFNSKTVIFWDACGILDILNLIGSSTNSTFLSVLLSLTEKIENNEIISVTSVIVKQEILDNYQEPFGQAKKFIDEIVRNYNKVQSYLYKLGQTDSFEEIVTNSEAILNIVERQIQIILNNTIFVNDEIFLKKARDRVVTKTPPSNRNEFKDSVIWETCLSVSQAITLDLYFVSSNERDYGKNGSRFENIQIEIDENDIAFKHKITDLYKLVNNIA